MRPELFWHLTRKGYYTQKGKPTKLQANIPCQQI